MDIEDRNYRLTYLKLIRKDKARKLYNEGIIIYILPKSLNPFSYYNQLVRLSQNCNFDSVVEFEKEDCFSKYKESLYYYYIDKTNPKEYRIGFLN